MEKGLREMDFYKSIKRRKKEKGEEKENEEN